MGKALVLSSGGSWAAWMAGAFSENLENVPENHYDVVYVPSASGFSAAKGLTDPNGLKLIWRTYTTERQFVNLTNCLRLQPVLNLEWLTHVL